MALPSNFVLSLGLLALVTLAHANIMVESIDGTFIPWSFVRRAGSGPVGIRLTNVNDVAYVVNALLPLIRNYETGTPPQQIQMATSLSQNFISVASPPTGVTDQSFYNPAISSSHTAGVGTASVQTISGGTVQGTYVDEICTLQSSTSASFFSYNASVVLTSNTVTNDLYPLDARGVLGYGLAQPSGTPASASLLGQFLPFSGNFTNVAVPANSPTSWSIPFDNLTYISNGPVLICIVRDVFFFSSDANQRAPPQSPADTGIQITSAAATQLYAGIPGSQPISSTLWSLPCSSKFPITLTFAGTPFTINERDTIIKQADGSCTGAVTGGATTIGKVGAPFLRNVYTQFFADVSAAGATTVGVGFATKNVRQISVFPTTTTPPSTSSVSQFTVKPSATSTAAPPKSSASRLNVQDLGRCLKLSIILVSAIILTLSY
ncbi:uncharacterized protein LACBIDRAFT_332113 [Laccaria bicolor S238N-H82]|uniref:Predicted protein n=1 Tax=Laccaria bicolor (strain S238N-H82 / ATCC MYA-4686) TaxID=486041 RepID=B0DRL9_LACBS|nr:uncharacterized protein LACBIDRAFT_332113 [Laccaria bicolor S238N-H82]EDR02807.1 predicted protein [Laccaria bicolor S238N-H82]|eukprot:XP_001886517.1 predicted protein [Laccaria bicolor S238N-H82]